MHHALCRGIGDGNNGYMHVTQTVAPPATAAKRFDAILRTELKGAEPVPGDPDGARWLAKPELKTYTLAYVRGAVLTRLTVLSPDKEFVAGLKDGLLKLKRVP
ncbi:MAG: hypothetical protein AB1730_02070 [Myxococcota bacterium]|jgi:hypothetical protein